MRIPRIANNNGFTLIEMIVVFSIIVVIATIIMIDFSANRLQLALARSSRRLFLDLHRVESYSLVSRSFQSFSVPNAWGLHFYGAASTQYTIFADRNSDNIRAADGSEDLETLNLEPNTSVTSSNITDVAFIPPDPTIIFKPDGITSASIVLSIVNGSASKTITINRFGAITIQ